MFQLFDDTTKNSMMNLADQKIPNRIAEMIVIKSWSVQ